jgi:putative transposase
MLRLEATGENFRTTRRLLVQNRSKMKREADLAIFELIEGQYNPHRRHSALCYVSPNNYE